MSIVYAVRCEELGLKGLLIGDYGAKAQDFIHRMVKDLPAHEYDGFARAVPPAEPGASVKT